MNQNVRKITEGAMMVALMGAFMLIDRQLQGTLSSSLVFLLPLPMVYYGAKYGQRDSLMVFAATVLITLIFASPFTVFFFIAEAIIGLIYGCGVHAEVESRKLLLRTMVLGGLTELLAVVISVTIFGMDIQELLTEFRTMFDTMMQFSNTPVPAAVNINTFLRNIFFMSTLFLGILEALVTHLLARLLLKRLRMKTPQSTPLYLYYPPKWMGYFGIAGMMGYLYVTAGYITAEPQTTIISAVGIFGVFYLMIMGMIGLLVAASFLMKKNSKVFVAMAFFLAIILPLPIAFFGFLYITTNMHRKIVEGGYHATKDQPD